MNKTEQKRPAKHDYRCSECGRRYGLSLTPTQVKEIKRRLASGATIANLAIAYGVTRQMVSRIKRGIAWQNIKP